MRAAIEEGLASSPWTDPGEGAHVARAASFYMQTRSRGRPRLPDHHDLRRDALSATCRATSPAQWLPNIHSRVYDPAQRPRREKQGVTIGMAMTEKQGGSDVRANTTRAIPVGAGRASLRDHRPQVLRLGADVRRVSGAGADAGRAVVFSRPPLAAGRDQERAAVHSAEAQDGQCLQRLERDGTARRARLDGRPGRARACRRSSRWSR